MKASPKRNRACDARFQDNYATKFYQNYTAVKKHQFCLWTSAKN